MQKFLKLFCHALFPRPNRLGTVRHLIVNNLLQHRKCYLETRSSDFYRPNLLLQVSRLPLEERHRTEGAGAYRGSPDLGGLASIAPLLFITASGMNLSPSALFLRV
jgi:hypothetical protein